MPHLFRTLDGKVWKASQPVALILADGTLIEGLWGGSAQHEKLDWWLRKPGHLLAQTDVVAAVAVRDDDTEEINWGDAPRNARLFFVLEAPVTGKNGEPYRLARMVTVATTPDELAFFRDTRFALFGSFDTDGSIAVISPLQPPPAKPPLQGELF